MDQHPQAPPGLPGDDSLDVAVIGMAGRFPGAPDLAAYWANLTGGVESIRRLSEQELVQAGVPRALFERADYVPSASTLEGIEQFDADFFGYGPKEASSIDPQSRLFLECAWQAFEDAGYDASRHQGSVGVFAAASLNTYMLRHIHPHLDLDDFILSGANLPHVIANGPDFLATRVSYKLNFKGPSVDVQTACSSALVAIHMARQSVLNGECDVAIAGGVSIYLPQVAGYVYQEGLILSRDGHCRVFDKDASGTIFGRGVGAVVLKPLQNALADGDRILAVIKGSAVNNDGADKVGYAAPSVVGQARVIAEALADADVPADTVSYVEAHGTGTKQGDPIEIFALDQAFKRSTDRRGFCRIGSVKSNIGHLDAASGVASFIKAVLMLVHRQVPPSLHFREQNPEIDFAATPFVVNTRLTDWNVAAFPRRAGVSAFGIGGTNAHMILEEAPPFVQSDGGNTVGCQVLTLSARSASALQRLVAAYAEALGGDAATRLADFCFTANTGRARFDHRYAAVGETARELQRQLQSFCEGATARVDGRGGGFAGRIERGARRELAFLFTGQGSQYRGMGRALYRGERVFRESFDECAAILEPLVPISLGELVLGDGSGEAELDLTANTQPALFAVEYALARLWLSWGLEPKALIGHSLGEYVAACIAGVWSLRDALTLVARRARLMQDLPAGGGMAAVFDAHDRVAEVLRDCRDSARTEGPDVAVAAINGPRNVVISGPVAAIDRVLQAFTARGVESRNLKVSHAFHSPLMEPMLAEFERFVRTVRFSEPSIPIVSNVTGKLAAPGQLCDPEYWVEHIRRPVQFAAGMLTLESLGCRVHLEIGPHPVLTGMGQYVLASGEHTWVPSLVRDTDENRQMREGLARLFAGGLDADWSSVDAERSPHRVAVPTYPFERERCWIEAPSGNAAARASETGHPLLRRRIRSPLSTVLAYQSSVSNRNPDYLDDHRIRGTAVVPMTAYLEMAIAAGRAALGHSKPQVRSLEIEDALVPGSGERLVQISLFPERGTEARFEIHSTPHDGDAAAGWTRHARGIVRERPGPDLPAGAFIPDEIRAACGEPLPGPDYYALLAERQLDYGPKLRGIESLWRGSGFALGRIKPIAGWLEDVDDYQVHPAHLDSCLQVVLANVLGDAQAGEVATFLPVGLERFDYDASAGHFCWSRAATRMIRDEGSRVVVDVEVLDDAGRPAAVISGIELRRASAAALARFEEDRYREWTYEVEWRREAGTSAQIAARLPGAAALGHELVEGLDPARTRHGLVVYEALLPQLDALCAEYVRGALQQLGWSPSAGDTGTTADLGDELGVLAQHRRFFARWLEILAEDGDLALEGDRWRVLRRLGAGTPAPLAERLRAEFPQAAPELSNLSRCGARLADVVRGAADLIELLFPRGSLHELENLYQNSLFARAYNELVGRLFSTVAAGAAGGPKLRILEIGAGTGSTTASVLAGLGAADTEYVFTDISPLFMARAGDKFHGRDDISYRVLDIEKDPRDQGFVPGTFDVVLASNAVHATADLEQTMRHVRMLLRPGGLLVLVEGVARQRWVDLIFGMTDGWWRLTDVGRRVNYPLLSPGQWRALLQELEFTGVTTVPDENRLTALFLQSIIVAEAPVTAGLPERATQAVRWLILADRQGLGARLADRLARLGDGSVLVRPGAGFDRLPSGDFCIDPTAKEPFARMLASLDEPGDLRGVIHLWSLDASGDERPATEIEQEQRAACGGLLSLAQALVSERHFTGKPLFLITRGSQSPGPEAVPSAVSPSVNWGLAKVLELEHPDLPIRRIDLDPLGENDDVECMMRELFAVDREEQVAYREHRRYLPRLRLSADAVDEERMALTPPAEGPFRLAIATPGVLDNLRLEPAARHAPGAGEVEVQVAYTGLNFLDVLGALDVAPVDPRPLGNECSGFVAAVGAGVVRFQVGDPVVAMAADAFRSFVSTPEQLVIRKPESMNLEESATLPAAFLTAYCALHHFAGMQRGERILIHAAAGGVGMAAVQLAQRAGAEIYATAGSQRKRDFLRSLGVPHVMDSRSLEFADEVLQLTAGSGVDIVLNCLAGEFIDKSVEALHPAGRFVEIGKTKVWSAEKFRAVRPHGKYLLVDLSAEAEANPAVVAEMFSVLEKAFAFGELRPLPHRTFSIRHAARAFRYMAQARHLGKVLVSRPHALRPAPAPAPQDKQLRLRPDSAYLITGGLGGLGRRLAGWLAEHGARHVVLVSRRQPPENIAREIRSLEAPGITVAIESADVSDFSQLKAVVDRIPRNVPLRGVIHAAGLLDDGVLLQQDWSRFRKVFAAKVDGAWNLHLLTRDLPLDFFVLFSSIASLFGSPGQANHSAANAFLDKLAHYRRTLGLEGLSINWGAWAEIGAFAERDVGVHVASRGIGTFSPEQGLAILEAALKSDAVQLGVAPVNWSRFLRQFPGDRAPRFYQLLTEQVQAPQPAAREQARTAYIEELLQAPAKKRRKLLLAFVQQAVIATLGTDPSRLTDLRRPLTDLGMDSLLAVEMRNVLGAGLGLDSPLPAGLLFDCPSIEALVEYLASTVLAPRLPQTAAPEPASEPDAAWADLEELSEEEADALLRQELADSRYAD